MFIYIYATKQVIINALLIIIMVSLLERNKRGRLFGELARVGSHLKPYNPFTLKRFSSPRITDLVTRGSSFRGG